MQMAQKTTWAIAVAMLSMFPILADGAPLLRVPWEGLSVVVGHTVRIAMPSGAVVAGKAIAVESDALLVSVAKTTDRNAYPKGPLRVPRAGLRRLNMLKKGVVGRAVLTPIGAFVGLIYGIAAAFNTKGSTTQTTAFVGITVAGIGGGYLCGNALDRHWTPVEILP